jgi:chromosomal replication initiator protein
MTQKFPFDQFLKWDEEKEPAAGLPVAKAAPLTQPASTGPVVDIAHEDLRLLGSEIKDTIRSYVNPAQYSAYFSDTFTITALTAQVIEFTVTTTFIRKVIESQYLTIIKKAVLDTLGREYQVEFKTVGARTTSLSSNDENILRGMRMEESKKSTAKDNTFVLPDLIPTSADKTMAISSRAMEQLESKPAHGYIDFQKKFTNFIVGPSNNLANASALAVAREPGTVYPSLYVYGGSGLGKTHLIHAIANHILEQRPHLKICITTCNNMMNEFVDATQTNKRPEFTKRYTRDIDVLIIDDIHDLAGKTGTQEQFFHIFNDLSNRKKQLIFTSDKTPKEIAGIEDRIRTRLSSALAVEIHQPDLETRIAILKTKAQEKDFYLNDEVVNLIAKCVKNSVRDLEGYLVQLKAYYDITHVDIDLELAREYLKLDEHIESQKLVTVDSITKAVAQYYKIPLGDIRGKSKTKEIVLARQVAMYLIHQHLRKTLLEIALFFGKKDHTTPMYSLEVVKKRLKNDQHFAQQMLEIENHL